MMQTRISSRDINLLEQTIDEVFKAKVPDHVSWQFAYRPDVLGFNVTFTAGHNKIVGERIFRLFSCGMNPKLLVEQITKNLRKVFPVLKGEKEPVEQMSIIRRIAMG